MIDREENKYSSILFATALLNVIYNTLIIVYHLTVEKICVNIHIFSQPIDDIIYIRKEIMTIATAVAKRIDEFLFSRNITLYKLAKDSGIPIATLQNLYRGNMKSPTLSLIYKLCIGLNISISEFLDGKFFDLSILELD